MLTIETRPYSPGDARTFVELAAGAFSVGRAHERPNASAAFLEHLHSDANPAGAAFVTLARDDGRTVGFLGGIPLRFLRGAGAEVTGWQLGCFAVDPAQHRRGIGAALLRHQIERHGRDRPGDFVYGFPNRRSAALLDGWGLCGCARVPSRIAPPALRRSSDLRDEEGERWELERLDAEGARREALAIEPDEELSGFARGPDVFRWRFLGPDADLRYRFLRLERRGGGERVLVALGRHEAFGARFTVLVDGTPDLTAGRLALALRAIRRSGDRRPIYLTTNARWRGGPRALRVPRRLDPRPVAPFLMPGSEAFEPDLAGARYLTGDWMAF